MSVGAEGLTHDPLYRAGSLVHRTRAALRDAHYAMRHPLSRHAVQAAIGSCVYGTGSRDPLGQFLARFASAKKNPLRNLANMLEARFQLSPKVKTFCTEAVFALLSGSLTVLSGSAPFLQKQLHTYLPGGRLPSMASSRDIRPDLVVQTAITCCIADVMRAASGYGDHAANLRRARFIRFAETSATALFGVLSGDGPSFRPHDLRLMGVLRSTAEALSAAIEQRISFTLRLQQVLCDLQPRRVSNTDPVQFISRDINVRAAFARLVRNLPRDANLPLHWIDRILVRADARRSFWEYVHKNDKSPLMSLTTQERDALWDFLVARRIHIKEIEVFGGDDALARQALKKRMRCAPTPLQPLIEERAATVFVCIGCRKVVSLCDPPCVNREQAGVSDVEVSGGEMLHRMARRKMNSREGVRDRGLPIIAVPLLQGDRLRRCRIFGTVYRVCGECGRLHPEGSACKGKES